MSNETFKVKHVDGRVKTATKKWWDLVKSETYEERHPKNNSIIETRSHGGWRKLDGDDSDELSTEAKAVKANAAKEASKAKTDAEAKAAKEAAKNDPNK